MSDLSTTIQHSFGHYFGNFLSRVQILAADLSEEEFWRNPYPYGNSIALTSSCAVRSISITILVT